MLGRNNMSTQAPTNATQLKEASLQERHIVRFTSGQRYLHAILIVTFLGLASTGLPLRFSGTVWAERFAHMVGGLAAILFFHKSCAVVLSTAFLIHVGDVLNRGLIKREKGIFWGPTSLVPQPKDFKDLYAHVKWFLWLGPKPKFGHFAYWEKFDYWAVFWGMVVIGLSGYAMWFAPMFALHIPGYFLNVALIIHGEEALLAVWFIFTIHFFNTHLRPGSFPMDLVIFTGQETEKEMKEKRPEAYQRLVDEGQLHVKVTSPPGRRLVWFARVAGTIVIATGFILLWLTLTAFFKG
jgi:cytochrome b subunit of formate dehydrogenase